MMDEIFNPIKRDYLSGMSYVSIGEKYGIDPRTAKRYALNNLPTVYLEQRPFVSVLDPYKPMINMWLKNGRLPSTIIHDRLLELGCNCGYTIVNDYVQKFIKENKKTAHESIQAESRRWNKSYEPGTYKEQQLKKAAIEKKRNLNK